MTHIHMITKFTIKLSVANISYWRDFPNFDTYRLVCNLGNTVPIFLVHNHLSCHHGSSTLRLGGHLGDARPSARDYSAGDAFRQQGARPGADDIIVIWLVVSGIS